MPSQQLEPTSSGTTRELLNSTLILRLVMWKMSLMRSQKLQRCPRLVHQLQMLRHPMIMIQLTLQRWVSLLFLLHCASIYLLKYFIKYIRWNENVMFDKLYWILIYCNKIILNTSFIKLDFYLFTITNIILKSINFQLVVQWTELQVIKQEIPKIFTLLQRWIWFKSQNCTYLHCDTMK